MPKFLIHDSMIREYCRIEVRLSPRGELFSADDIKARLTMRDFMDTLRASGIHTGGPAALSQADRRAFGRHLDTLLASHARQSDQGA